MDRLYLAEQMNAAIRLLAQKLDLTDSERMQIADLFPVWAADRHYPAGIIVRYGENTFNEAQLWRVSEEHISVEDKRPDKAVDVFAKVGYSDEGVPIWTQPLGEHDAYECGDEVAHSGKKWVCEADKNTLEPGVGCWIETK